MEAENSPESGGRKIVNNDLSEDGPEQMIANGPDKKRQNAADRFEAENQGYSHKKNEDNNNNADKNKNRRAEQKTKRKTGKYLKVTTLKPTDMGEEFDCNCLTCVQLATLNNLKKKLLKPKCKCECKQNKPTREQKKTEEADNDGDTSKRRKRKSGRSCENPRCPQHYARQCLTIDSAHSLASKQEQNKRRKRDPSASTYSSFDSYSHEPMI